MFSTTASRAIAAALAYALSGLAAPATAGPGHGATEAGEPGKASAVSRTITVTMGDNFYEPETISVKEGETIRFVVKNEGTLVHEFNIGTAKMLMDHAPEMQMMVDHGVLEADRINHEAAKAMQASMGHGEHKMPNAALLEPGQTGEVVWKFPEHAEIEFGCTVPGHYEAGMVGEFKLTH